LISNNATKTYLHVYWSSKLSTFTPHLSLIW
jgi:hypothetical protein